MRLGRSRDDGGQGDRRGDKAELGVRLPQTHLQTSKHPWEVSGTEDSYVATWAGSGNDAKGTTVFLLESPLVLITVQGQGGQTGMREGGTISH